MRTAGVGLNEIARRVGVAPSTVRLTLKRLLFAMMLAACGFKLKGFYDIKQILLEGITQDVSREPLHWSGRTTIVDESSPGAIYRSKPATVALGWRRTRMLTDKNSAGSTGRPARRRCAGTGSLPLRR